MLTYVIRRQEKPVQFNNKIEQKQSGIRKAYLDSSLSVPASYSYLCPGYLRKPTDATKDTQSSVCVLGFLNPVPPLATVHSLCGLMSFWSWKEDLGRIAFNP